MIFACGGKRRASGADFFLFALRALECKKPHAKAPKAIPEVTRSRVGFIRALRVSSWIVSKQVNHENQIRSLIARLIPDSPTMS